VLLILPLAMPNYITALIWKGMFHQQFGVITSCFKCSGSPRCPGFDRPATSFLTRSSQRLAQLSLHDGGLSRRLAVDLAEPLRSGAGRRARPAQQFKAITPRCGRRWCGGDHLGRLTFNSQHHLPGHRRRAEQLNRDPGDAGYKFAFERYRYGYAAAYST